jgi:predicted component of type VI protein secretion system
LSNRNHRTHPEVPYTVINYGVPEGAPAICHENAKKEDAVKSIAGSTVE